MSVYYNQALLLDAHKLTAPGVSSCNVVLLSLCAGFIFGGNKPAGSSSISSGDSSSDSQKGEAIAMTSPVRMEIQDSSKRDGAKIAMT